MHNSTLANVPAGGPVNGAGEEPGILRRATRELGSGGWRDLAEEGDVFLMTGDQGRKLPHHHRGGSYVGAATPPLTAPCVGARESSRVCLGRAGYESIVARRGCGGFCHLYLARRRVPVTWDGWGHAGRGGGPVPALSEHEKLFRRSSGRRSVMARIGAGLHGIPGILLRVLSSLRVPAKDWKGWNYWVVTRRRAAHPGTMDGLRRPPDLWLPDQFAAWTCKLPRRGGI